MNERLPQPIPPQEQYFDPQSGIQTNPTLPTASLDGTATHLAIEDKRVDLNKAWDMAHAAKPERDHAAKLRKDAANLSFIAKPIGDGYGGVAVDERKVSEILDVIFEPAREAARELGPLEDKLDTAYRHRDFYMSLPDYRTENEATIATLQQQRERIEQDDLRAIAKKALEPYQVSGGMVLRIVHETAYEICNRNNPSTSSQTRPHYNPQMSKDAYEVELTKRLISARATAGHDEYHDNVAERTEYWAGILSDNPPSKAFVQSQPQYRQPITAKLLTQIAGSIPGRKALCERVFDRLDSVLASPTIINLINRQNIDDLVEDYSGNTGYEYSPGHIFERVYGKQSNELADWKRMTQDPNTTLGQLNEKYIAAVKEALRPRLEDYKADETLLDDIRAGRACTVAAIP